MIVTLYRQPTCPADILYNIRHRASHFAEYGKWLMENKIDAVFEHGTIKFRHDEDALMFKLTFGI